MLFFGIIWMISGLVFVGLDIHDHYRDWVNSANAAITAFVVVFFIFVAVFGVCGFKLAR